MSGVRIDEYDDNYTNGMRSSTVVISEATAPSIPPPTERLPIQVTVQVPAEQSIGNLRNRLTMVE
jgi:hypothetical protein